jgi:hypothetical protein
MKGGKTMQHSIFIVSGYDADTKEFFEHEEPQQQGAEEIYNALVNQEGIKGLAVIEYNTTTKVYKLVK